MSDALVLLGADPPRLAALDRALGGALAVATGGVSDGVLRIADARGRILGLGRDAVRGVGRRLGAAGGRAERGELLRAAHTVVVVLGWFEALAELDLPFSLDEVRLTRDDQLALVGAGGAGAVGGTGERDAGFAQALAAVDAPLPAPHLPPEAVAGQLLDWYAALSRRFERFVAGLAVRDRLTPAEWDAVQRTLTHGLPAAAAAHYDTLYAQLAQQAPEFGFWVAQNEHRATRDGVQRALAGIEALLAASAATARPPVDVAAALALSHRAALSRPVLDAESAPEGIRVPALEEMYLDPDFRVRAVAGQHGPADESWWERTPVREDLTRYLAGALTSSAQTRTPLLVLGQPGAGKSVLTRVLAARLPAAGFLPVRVPLRDVRAEDDLQEQIENAVRAATGERVTWPELVRAAGGAVPVLLLDGFDELLQTTGVHHNDFLVRVARFQEREAEQGRPLLALVTSRTSVADRARYPQGMVALRLEPFRAAQIQRWLAVWNDANAAGFAAQGLRPLSWEVVSRHAALAAQPLLLTMLALYDVAGNGLQRDGGEPLDEADLYEELLFSFARREVGKTSRDTVPDDEMRERAELEMQRLSLVAFALLNRRRQWVSAAELDEDLTALLGRGPAGASGFRTPLGAAEVALGRFFFVQRAQSVRDGQVLATYEFLHATFGEYLAVRLALHVLTDLLRDRPTLALGDARVDDDLAYALLSYAPLSGRQMLRFAKSMTARMPEAERARLGRLLVRVLDQHETRTGDQHPAYRPTVLRVASRHGLYGANLVLVILLLTGGVSAGELFPGSANPVSAWHRHALLWRSALNEEQWTDFALSLSLRRSWGPDGRGTLGIALREGELRPPDPVDANWLYRYPQGHGGPGWSRPYWDEIWHKMEVSGGTNDSLVRHVMDPVFAWLGPSVTTFVASEGQPATSLAHDLLHLLLSDGTELDPMELELAYRRVLLGIGNLPSSHVHHVIRLLRTAVRRDESHLPAELLREIYEWTR
ncbi:hypothetical protein EOT10_20800 [Streptomyces antnestii]|uniref:NACHT N-terminal Helical domain-containing protein n=1 Tax=Streptomyces antnestii TaxID=2494256 RepID=A0A437PKT7_9ACTN|nr:hypothetical protein [Streptomyces sp. San01]RVU22911.1 hypothetical protein EOT10_20800 [Streptomyces sp. San01]